MPRTTKLTAASAPRGMSNMSSKRAPGGRRVAESEPHPCARAGLQFERRCGAVGEDEAASAADAAGEDRVVEIVPDLAPLIEAPVRQHDRDVLIDVDLLGFVDDDRTEQATALLAGVGRSAVGQVQVEAGVGWGEDYVRAPLGRKPRPGQPAVAGAGVGRPETRKAERRRLAELVDEPKLQLL